MSRATSSQPPHILLLTGAPGVGKTTVMRRVLHGLGDRRLRGFLTEEIRQGRTRVGFRLETLDGRRAILAHRELRSPHRVGRYGVDVEALDRIVRHALQLEAGVDAYLVDEIGKMECCSPLFEEAMMAILDSTRPLVATIALRAGGFVQRVKERRDVELWTVTVDSRDRLPAQVISWLPA